jgi:hypothetical protein
MSEEMDGVVDDLYDEIEELKKALTAMTQERDRALAACAAKDEALNRFVCEAENSSCEWDKDVDKAFVGLREALASDYGKDFIRRSELEAQLTIIQRALETAGMFRGYDSEAKSDYQFAASLAFSQAIAALKTLRGAE